MTQDTTNEKSSRRGLFKWLGKVAAGASVAGLGLGAAAPLTAQASAKKATRSKVGAMLDKAGNILIPNCIICDGCNITYCAPNGSCRAADPNNAVLVRYTQYYGCFTRGACPSYQYAICTTSCSCE